MIPDDVNTAGFVDSKNQPRLVRDYTAGEVATAALISTFAFVALFSFSVLRARSELSDFAAHWTACRLFRTNPFDVATATRLQEHLAAHIANVQIMANPPWTALLFIPYAALSYAYATAFWVVTSVCILWLVAIYFWRALGQRDNTLALGITFLFAPTIAMLSIAQVDAVLLLAMVIFLFGARHQNWVAAGLGLALFSIKPHLMFLPALSILLWSLRHRCWRLLIHANAIFAVWVAATIALNRVVFFQWFAFLHQYLSSGESYPTLPNALGMIHPWLRFLPLLFGVAFVIYRWLTMSSPDWDFELPLITSVGLATSFYGYYHDQVLALPLLFNAFSNGNRKVFWALFCLADALVFIHLEIFPKAITWYYFPVWTAMGWLVISVVSLRGNSVHCASFPFDDQIG
jgi:hypothetical protein